MDCLFCEIAAGNIPSTTLYEDDMLRVIFDISPASRGHVLILPKAHSASLLEADEDVIAAVFAKAKELGAKMQKTLGCEGVNVLANCGAGAGQTVDHFHVHVIPRYPHNPALDGLHISQDPIDEQDFQALRQLLS